MNTFCFLTALFLLFTSFSSLANFSHESEVSSVVTGGNSELATYLVRTKNQLNQEKYSYLLSGHYTYGESASEVSARDWDIYARIERTLTPKISLYFAELIEGYRFQGIKARYNTDIGIKYFFTKSDLKNFFAEAGYRYTFEDRYQPEPNQYENKARIYSEFNHKPTVTYLYRLWAEYLPNFTNKGDYIVTYEASLTSILNSVFSLKVAYRAVYDDQPAITGNKKYDYTYTTALVSKF